MDFPGHTEFLAHLTRTRDVVMMLAGPRLRVALATIHEALARVPDLLTHELLQRTIEITGKALRQDFAIETPRVAVAGLNPHAGEQGRFGNEESSIIEPVVDTFVDAPFRVSGPHPPDTVFLRAYSGEFDAVVAMYHDQGLIPIKLVHFADAVNITLGLPIIRTSVDHGTAYDLAGTGKAPLLGDDGFGPRVIESLCENYPLPPSVSAFDVGTGIGQAAYHRVVDGLGGRGFLLDDPACVDTTLAAARDAAREGVPVLVNALIGDTEFRKGSMSL